MAPIITGDPMNASLNVEFTLSLESNPTTGYVWEATFDRVFLELKKKEFKESDGESVGSGGIETLTFVPIKAGRTEITMVHKRQWESIPLERRSFPIQITE